MILNQVQDDGWVVQDGRAWFSSRLKESSSALLLSCLARILEAGVVPRGDGVELCLDGIGDVQRI